MKKSNSPDVSVNYPFTMSECFNVGMSGGCGPECYICLEGRCAEPQEMLPRLDDQGIALHYNLYAEKITEPKQ